MKMNRQKLRAEWWQTLVKSHRFAEHNRQSELGALAQESNRELGLLRGCCHPGQETWVAVSGHHDLGSSIESSLDSGLCQRLGRLREGID